MATFISKTETKDFARHSVGRDSFNGTQITVEIPGEETSLTIDKAYSALIIYTKKFYDDQEDNQFILVGPNGITFNLQSHMLKSLRNLVERVIRKLSY